MEYHHSRINRVYRNAEKSLLTENCFILKFFQQLLYFLLPNLNGQFWGDQQSPFFLHMIYDTFIDASEQLMS